MKKLEKVNKLNFKKLKKYITIILFITMLILIYIVSPKITGAIQTFGKWLYELDEIYITRVVELILSVTFVTALFIGKEGK